MAWALAGCSGVTSAVESQSKSRDARLARMYFMRAKSVMGDMGATGGESDVRVDGKLVGTLINNSYFFVDRPPGKYILSLEMKRSSAFETDVQLDAGGTYYFNAGVPATGAPGMDLANMAMTGSRGEQMQGHRPFPSSYAALVFNRLELSAGAAEIEKLKAH
jgi:hypothetical protein